MILSIIGQIFLLLFLFTKDKNDGDKELFKKQQWKSFDIIIVLLVMEIYPLYFILATYIFLKMNIDLRPLIYSLSNRNIVVFVSLISLFLLILLFRFKFKQNINILGFSKVNIIKNIVLGILVAFAFFFIIDGLYLMLFPKQFQENIIEMITTLKNPVDYFLLFLGTVLLGPFIEEIVYRGILYSPFRKKYGPIKAIFIVSLFFGLVHTTFPLAFFAAISLTSLYEKTESIISTITAHSVHNLLVIIVAFYLLK
jgi:uncharacterized protein